MKSVNKTKKLALALLLFAVLALTPAVRAAEIWTDQEDYSPWELVTLSGSGFEPLSDMTVTVEGPGEWGIDEFYGTADEYGSFCFMYAKEKCEGTFYVTATDSASPPNTATTTFTDSVSSATITSSPVTVTSLPATVTVSFNYVTSETGTTTADAEILTTPKLSASKGVTPGTGSDSITVTIPAGTANGSYNAKVTVTNTSGTGANSKTDVANGAVIVNVSAPPSDTTPPTTTITLNPIAPNGDYGWYISDVAVTLTATDNEGGSGVAAIYYVLDGGATQTYVAPLTISTDGIHTLEYWAIDNASPPNEELPHNTATIMIDKMPPVGSITINDDDPYTNTTSVTLNLSATDATGISRYGFFGGGYQVAFDPISPFIADIPWTLSPGDGTKTVTVQYRDVAGNWSANYTDDILLDTTPPATTALLSGTEGDNGWYVSNVIVTLTADDPIPGSGVAAIYYAVDDPLDVQTYLAPFTISTDGVHTIYYCAVDNAGNEEDVQMMEVKIDQTPPEITITTPADGAEYLLNQNVIANWSATDATSGIASSSGTVASGSAIDTATVGERSFTVNATDNAGNTNSLTVHYKVEYDFGGFLPPVIIEGKGVGLFKLGSTIPVKFQLFDAVGNPVSTAQTRIRVVKLSDGEPVGETEVDGVSTGKATEGNLFRYDSTGQLYIFNLTTKSLSIGTWRIIVLLDDGTTQSVEIGFKK